MSAEVRKTGRSFRYCLFFPCSFHPKITKMQVVPKIIGEAKKETGTTPSLGVRDGEEYILSKSSTREDVVSIKTS
jgi:hypothetical protein